MIAWVHLVLQTIARTLYEPALFSAIETCHEGAAPPHYLRLYLPKET